MEEIQMDAIPYASPMAPEMESRSSLNKVLDHWGFRRPATQEDSTEVLVTPTTAPKSWTALFPVPLAGYSFGNAMIHAPRHAFLCVLLAGSKEFDVPFDKKVGLADYLFHRLEKVAYDFTLRVMPLEHALMFLEEEHDLIDLEDWSWFLDHGRDNWPEGTVANKRNKCYDWSLATKLRQASAHCRDYELELVKDTVAWVAYLKDDAALDDIQQILQVLYYDECKAKGSVPEWEVRDADKEAYYRAMGLVWVPCRTTHQYLHKMAKLLQKACFNFWQKHRSVDDTRPWTCAEHIELQNWAYKHSGTLMGFFAEKERAVVGNLLSSLPSIRNADAHRLVQGSERLDAYQRVTIRLLGLFDEPKSILDISIAEQYIHAGKAELHKRALEEYGPNTDWDDASSLAWSQSRRYQKGFRQWPQDRHLQSLFENAGSKFCAQSKDPILQAAKEIIKDPLHELGWDIERKLGDWGAMKKDWLWDHERVMNLNFDGETGSEISEETSYDHIEDSSSEPEDPWQSDADDGEQSEHDFEDSAWETQDQGVWSEDGQLEGPPLEEQDLDWNFWLPEVTPSPVTTRATIKRKICHHHQKGISSTQGCPAGEKGSKRS